MNKLASLIFSLLFVQSAHSLTDRTWFIGSGLLNHNLLRTSLNQSSQSSLLGSTYIPVHVKTFYSIQNNYYWSPNVIFTQITSYLTPKETPEGGTKKNLFLLGSPLAYSLTGNSYFTFGPGLMIYTIDGGGGTKELNNGTSTTTFLLPAKSNSSILYYLDLGFGLNRNQFCFEFDLYTTSLFNSERRSYTLLIGVSYAL